MNPSTTTRVALVTGASSGIGASTADLLAAAGFRVFGTSRRELPSSPAVEMLRVDVRDDDQVAAAVESLAARTGRVDLLVNNAGVMHEGMAEETSIESVESMFATNLFGVARMTNAVLPVMRARRRGRIINVGSLAAWIGEPGESFYAASKAALARYTESLRYELAPLGIHVSLVEPGAFATNVLDAASVGSARFSDYDRIREATRWTMRKAMADAPGPGPVARTIVRAARARRPRLRYGVGRGRTWIPLIRTLPQPLLDRLIRRSFGLPRRTQSPSADSGSSDNGTA